MGIRTAILLVALFAAVAFDAGAQIAKERSPATESLFLAIGTNDINAVKRSLLAGADVEAVNDDGRTPIDVAIDRGHFPIAHFLLAWRTHLTKPPPPVVVPAPVVVEQPPPTVPAAREPPSVLSPTPVAPVTAQPLSPSPPPVARATPTTSPPPAMSVTPAPAMAVTPAPAPPPASQAKTATPAAAKPSGGFLDGIARFFTGAPAATPEKPPEAAAPAAPAAAPAAPAATPAAPAPAAAAPQLKPSTTTGKITPPAEAVAPQEGFLEGLARFFSGKAKSEAPAGGAAKPQSSLPTPVVTEPASAPATVATAAPMTTISTPATPPTPAPMTTIPTPAPPTAGTPAGDSLLDHIAKVLAEAQRAEPPAPLSSAMPPPTPTGTPSAMPSEATVAAPTTTPPEPTAAADKPATPPPEPTAAVAPAPAPAPAPVPAPALAPAAAPASVAEPAAAAAQEVAATPPETTPGDGDKGELLGRITEFFTVGPQPPPAMTAPETGTTPGTGTAPPAQPAAQAAAQAAARRAAVAPWLGADQRLGKPRPNDRLAVCVDKPAVGATFCIESVNWPASIADAFDVQTQITRGRQAIVRYDGGVASQSHVLFPTANYRAVVDYFSGVLGPPGETPELSAVAIGQANRKNRTARWLGPKDPGGDVVLEVREIDDLRWSAPPDATHGVVRLFRFGSDMMFQHVSWSDFLLAKIHQARE